MVVVQINNDQGYILYSVTWLSHDLYYSNVWHDINWYIPYIPNAQLVYHQ